jgi:hypothetical protein
MLYAYSSFTCIIHALNASIPELVDLEHDGFVFFEAVGHHAGQIESSPDRGHSQQTHSCEHHSLHDWTDDDAWVSE